MVYEDIKWILGSSWKTPSRFTDFRLGQSIVNGDLTYIDWSLILIRIESARCQQNHIHCVPTTDDCLRGHVRSNGWVAVSRFEGINKVVTGELLVLEYASESRRGGEKNKNLVWVWWDRRIQQESKYTPIIIIEM